VMLGQTQPQTFAAKLAAFRQAVGKSVERQAFLDVMDLLARQAAEAGDAQAIGGEVAMLDRFLGDGDPHWRLRDAAGLARLWSEADTSPRRCAQSALDYAAAARAAGRMKSALRGLIVSAWAGRAAGAADWTRPLAEAVDLASSTGIVLPYMERNRRHSDLLEAALASPSFGDQPIRATAKALLERLSAAATRQSGVLLSRREHQVLAALRGGGANKVIARTLGLTERTVKFHISNIARKLSVSGRRDILDAAVREGLTG